VTDKPIRAALYLRVSTLDKGQNTDNQKQALETEAARRGWSVVACYEDQGISGAKGRDKRPGLDMALKDATRRRFDVLMVWAVDRLGRSLQDLLANLQSLHLADVDLIMLQSGIDTRTPAGRAMFQMMGVFAEFERAMIQSRVRAGLERRRKEGKRFGRPTLGTGPNETKRQKGIATRAKAEQLIKGGASQNETRRQTGLSFGLIRRLTAELQAIGRISA